MSTFSKGFSAVELLISLFVAAAFITAGYTLYSVITQDSEHIRSSTRATNLASEYIDHYRNSTGNCTASTPLDSSPVTVNGLTNVTVTVAITCPNPSIPAVTRVTVTVRYNTPQKTIEISSFGGPQQ